MTARKCLALTLFVLGACIAAAGALAKEDKSELNKGDKAPSFEATDDQGKTWKSGDHVGKHILVIYFYPADFTGGCTKQACAFRDNAKALADKGVEVVGVSGDSAKNHEQFKKYHKLDFTLLADEDGAIAKKFGIPVGKGGEVTVKDLDNLKIQRGVTISRWTVIIDKDGKVIHKEAVKAPDQDPKTVLEVIEKAGK